MQIITGKTGTNHVSAEDDRGKHAGIFGKDEYVLNVGNKFSATVESANTIRLASGDGVMQGTHFRIPHGKYDDVTIDNGTTGYMRKDLIVARYKKVGDIESVTSAVLKGTPVASDPQAPEYTQGNILEGASFSEMPMYEVLLDGVNIVSVTSLFKVWTGFDDVYRKEEADTLLKTKSDTSHNHDSVYYKRSDVVCISTTSVYDEETGQNVARVNYPDGFTKDNCVILSYGVSNDSSYYHYNQYSGNTVQQHICMYETHIEIYVDTEETLYHKITLLKV